MNRYREGTDMDNTKRARLEKAGWKIGTATEFLGLSKEESAYLELKLNLAKAFSERRKTLGLSQVAVAKKIKSSQSRVAKMEAGDPSVSIDLLVKSLFALGETAKSLQQVF
jgi:ribosome-binding protein aMBF1 (putative translation factor)